MCHTPRLSRRLRGLHFEYVTSSHAGVPCFMRFSNLRTRRPRSSFAYRMALSQGSLSRRHPCGAPVTTDTVECMIRYTPPLSAPERAAFRMIPNPRLHSECFSIPRAAVLRVSRFVTAVPACLGWVGGRLAGAAYTVKLGELYLIRRCDCVEVLSGFMAIAPITCVLFGCQRGLLAPLRLFLRFWRQ